MTITYKVATTKDEIVKFVLIAVKAKLFQMGGNLSLDYAVILDDMCRRKKCMVIAYKGKLPVGVVLMSTVSREVNTYVVPAYRKNGVGRGLIQTLRSHLGLTNSLLIGTAGYEGWEQFFESNHIYVMCYTGKYNPKLSMRQNLGVINDGPKRAMRKALRLKNKELAA